MAEVMITWLVLGLVTRNFRADLREQVRPHRSKRVPAAHRPLSRRQSRKLREHTTWNEELAATESDLGVVDRIDCTAEPAPIYEQIAHKEPAPLDEEVTAFASFDLEFLTAFALAKIDLDLLAVECDLDKAQASW